jgi:putative effector of murein hydrolase
VAIDFPIAVDDGLLAVVVVLAGVYGAVVLPGVARRLRLDGPEPLGLGAGVAAHAVAAAELARRSPPAAGWAVAGLAVNGVLTTLWLPPVLRLLL